MSKDYASRQVYRKRKSPSQWHFVSSIVWLVVVAGVCVGLWYAKQQYQQGLVAAATFAKVVQPQQQPVHAATRHADVAEPRFDFYQLLPTMEVDEGNASSAASSVQHVDVLRRTPVATTVQQTTTPPDGNKVIEGEKPPAEATAAANALPSSVTPAHTVQREETVTPPAPLQYLVQVASFARYEDADEMKARLLLLGFSAKVNMPQGSKTKNYYRVILGPFARKDIAEQAQQRLSQAHFSSVMLAMQQPPAA